MRAQARYDQVILRLQRNQSIKVLCRLFTTDLIAIPEIAEKQLGLTTHRLRLGDFWADAYWESHFAITADLFDQTIKSVDELEALAGCSVIAHSSIQLTKDQAKS